MGVVECFYYFLDDGDWYVDFMVCIDDCYVCCLFVVVDVYEVVVVCCNQVFFFVKVECVMGYVEGVGYFGNVDIM